MILIELDVSVTWQCKACEAFVSVPHELRQSVDHHGFGRFDTDVRLVCPECGADVRLDDPEQSFSVSLEDVSEDGE